MQEAQIEVWSNIYRLGNMTRHLNDKEIEKLQRLETGAGDILLSPTSQDDFIFPHTSSQKEPTRADLYRTTYLLLLHAFIYWVSDLVLKPSEPRPKNIVYFVYTSVAYLILFLILAVASSPLKLFRTQRIELPYIAMYGLFDWASQVLTAQYAPFSIYVSAQLVEVIFALVLPPIALWFLFLINDDRPSRLVFVSIALVFGGWAIGFGSSILNIFLHKPAPLYWNLLRAMIALLRDIVLTNTMHSFSLTPAQYFYTVAPVCAFVSLLAVPLRPLISYDLREFHQISWLQHAEYMVFDAAQVVAVYVGAVIMQRTSVMTGILAWEGEFALREVGNAARQLIGGLVLLIGLVVYVVDQTRKVLERIDGHRVG